MKNDVYDFDEIREPVPSKFEMISLSREMEERAQRLHRDNCVIDTCNTAEWDEDYILNRLKPSGVDVIVKTLAAHGDYMQSAMQLSKWFKKMREFKDHLVRVTSAEEISKARADGRIAVIYGLQNSEILNHNLDYVEVVHELGVRIMQLTYNKRGVAGDGCLESRDGGLSDWGVKLVERMNKLGILVDVSHASLQTARDVIEVSSVPVAFSHSNCSKLVSNPRNITDDVINDLIESNGYLGIAVFGSMISEDRNRTPSLEEVILHIDHVIQLGGEKNVGYGLDRGEGRTLRQYLNSDFPPDSYPTWDQRNEHLVPEIRSVYQFINLTRLLVKKTYGDAQITGILGGNFLRVFGEVVR